VFLGINIITTLMLTVLNAFDLFVKTAVVRAGVLKTAAEMPELMDADSDLELVFGRRLTTEEVTILRRSVGGGGAVALAEISERLSCIEDVIPTPLRKSLSRQDPNMATRESFTGSGIEMQSVAFNPMLGAGTQDQTMPAASTPPDARRPSLALAMGRKQVALDVLQRRATTRLDPCMAASLEPVVESEQPEVEEEEEVDASSFCVNPSSPFSPKDLQTARAQIEALCAQYAEKLQPLREMPRFSIIDKPILVDDFKSLQEKLAVLVSKAGNTPLETVADSEDDRSFTYQDFIDMETQLELLTAVVGR
jgi:hypothetical protein